MSLAILPRPAWRSGRLRVRIHLSFRRLGAGAVRGSTDLIAVTEVQVAVALAGALAAILLVLVLRPRASSGRLDRLAADLARDGAELRLAVETRLAALADANVARIGGLQDDLSHRLHRSVGEQMQTSFTRVAEQMASMQRAVGDVQSSAAQIADLKRLFSSVRARGAWGEGQLRALLDDILPAGAYETDCRLREGEAGMVEFAVRMPASGLPAERRPLLAIDAKFPTVAYDRLLAAEEAGDPAAARLARRALETALRTEARRIAGKYILPPVTVDYAVLYLPTDGLYVEASRLPGLLDELGRVQRVLVMGPAILPGLLRSIRLGAMTLALGERAETIGRLLGATRHEIQALEETLDKLARHAGAAAASIEEARRVARAIGRRLSAAAETDAVSAEG